MTPMEFVQLAPSSSDDWRLEAACTLGPGEMRERLAEWRALVARSQGTRETDTGVVLTLSPDEPMRPLADLVERESACCSFYRFTVEMHDGARELTIDAGPDGFPAVAVLLSLDA
jgi:hypothetical protein